MIRKLLIANRGEIACRIMRTAKACGMKTVAVYSDADANALHVRMADEAVRIGAATPSESYLKIDAIIGAAKLTGADAIHPGYGFVSERAAFAQACEEAGIVFVGPPASAIAAMGDKAESKRRMIAAGVPCVPGYQGEDQTDARLSKEAKAIGFPVMVKASAGGGGRGMRIVNEASELEAAIASARKEAENAFGDGRLLIEKAVTGARHVEIQVIADKHGNVIHLGERDCSLQRRRQKVIEESPSPVVSLDIRMAMGAAAVEAARAVGYENAGTVEFLFDPAAQAFYFLEMNTRLQVEHPVTECVTGLDLVELQLGVAEGKPLPLKQEDVTLSGWAIEARLYAEDPAHGFLPQMGRIAALQFSDGDGVRVDAGVETGDEVTAFYDPMIAKVIASGATRDEAREKLASALEKITLLGLTANASFLVELLRDEAFAAGRADINYIEANLARLAPPPAPVSALEAALAAAILMDRRPGDLLTGWNSRGDCAFPLKMQYGESVLSVSVIATRNSLTTMLGEESATVEILSAANGVIRYRNGARIGSACFSREGETVDLKAGAQTRRFIDVTYTPASDAGAGADVVKAPMAGAVTGVFVKSGDAVKKGQIVIAIEAMKMEHKLAAPRDGVIAEVLAAPGDQVAIRTKLVSLGAA